MLTTYFCLMNIKVFADVDDGSIVQYYIVGVPTWYFVLFKKLDSIEFMKHLKTGILSTCTTSSHTDLLADHHYHLLLISHSFTQILFILVES